MTGVPRRSGNGEHGGVQRRMKLCIWARNQPDWIGGVEAARVDEAVATMMGKRMLPGLGLALLVWRAKGSKGPKAQGPTLVWQLLATLLGADRPWSGRSAAVW